MRLLLAPFIVFLLVACSGPEAGTQQEVGWSAIPNAYARHFQLQVRGADRRLVVFGPAVDGDTVGIYRLIGTPSGREVAIADPLERVAVVSTTHLPFFSALGAAGTVVGVAHADQVRDPLVKARVGDGLAQEISRADGLDRERLIALDPQALFDYPFGRGGQHQEAWRTTVAVTEYLEEHPLGRAEWIRFFGFLLGRQHRSDSLFEAIAHRYEVTRDLRTHLGKPPTVLFGSQWEQRWWVPPGNSYMATLITDAGGRYWFADSVAEGNIALALEHVLQIGRECDHMGLVLAAEDGVDADRLVGGDPRMAGLDAVRKGGFFGNSAHHDLFGQALLEPEVVLQDLRCIFHPRSCSDHVPRYFLPIVQ